MANYVSNYTGAEVDAILTKADTIPVPTAQDIDKVLAVGANGIEWAEGAGSSSALPEYNFADGGKILAVSSESGEPELVWENNVKVPSAVNNNGKILKVVNDNGTINWEPESTGIPSYSQADEGKVLGISSNVVTWITNSGGSGGGASLPAQQNSGIEQILIIDDNGNLGWKSLNDMYITSDSSIISYIENKISDVRGEIPTISCDMDTTLHWLQEADTSKLDYYMQAADNAPSGINSVLVHNSDGNLQFVDPATLFSN